MELTPFVVSGLMLCFLWSGFIRSGLGFGGLVLTLPFALMVVDSPLDIIQGDGDPGAVWFIRSDHDS